MEDFINKIMDNIQECLLDGVEDEYKDALLQGYRQSLENTFQRSGNKQSTKT